MTSEEMKNHFNRYGFMTGKSIEELEQMQKDIQKEIRNRMKDLGYSEKRFSRKKIFPLTRILGIVETNRN